MDGKGTLAVPEGPSMEQERSLIDTLRPVATIAYAILPVASAKPHESVRCFSRRPTRPTTTTPSRPPSRLRSENWAGSARDGTSP